MVYSGRGKAVSAWERGYKWECWQWIGRRERNAETERSKGYLKLEISRGL